MLVSSVHPPKAGNRIGARSSLPAQVCRLFVGNVDFVEGLLVHWRRRPIALRPVYIGRIIRWDQTDFHYVRGSANEKGVGNERTAQACRSKAPNRAPTHLMVTSASGVFSGSPFRNACDITILDEFASLIVPWKMPNSSMHLIDTALPIQFSPIVAVCLFRFVC